MKLSSLVLALSASVALAASATGAYAQAAPAATPPAASELPPPLFETVLPPQNFKTSTEHYDFLKALWHGGTQHTWESVPHWDGLWQPSWNNIALRGDRSVFFQGKPPAGLQAGGTPSTGVLSEEYQAAFEQRRENMKQYNEQPYDRLTTCEAPGMPRWLLEPYVREFVNTPDQSWWLNDLANDTRRIYIGQEHQNIDNAHFPTGDSVGFWAGDHLVVHTVDVWPNDYFRGFPPTSNQFEAVEVLHRETLANGDDRIIDNVTFYDPIGLSQPLNGVYTFTKATNLEDRGYRIRWWECDTNLNITQDPNGETTQMALPGEAGFFDIRGEDHKRRNPDLPADLSGQDRNPDAGDDLSLDAALGAASN